MRASCFCSWSSCRRSCSAPTVFSCWSASTPFRMPSSLVMTGSNFSSSFFSMVSPTEKKLDEKFDPVITKLDGILKGVEALQQENTVGAEQLRRHEDQLQKHEARIAKLETASA